jgi:predicted transcriptional regulator
MANISQRQLVNILTYLRQCRAAVLQDREAFGKAALGLEHIAQFAGAPVGVGLGRSRDKILALVKKEDDETRQKARSLFEAVLEARNMAVHDGAWVRHRSDQLVELLLLLEQATLHELTSIEQVMVGSVAVAEPWHQLAHVRRTMLSNSFSFLPVLMTRWQLLSDEAIVAITRVEANETRKARLSLTVEEAVKRHKLRLIDADTVSPDEFVSNLMIKSRTWPVLVTEGGSQNGRLVGIVTPFDLL